MTCPDELVERVARDIFACVASSVPSSVLGWEPATWDTARQAGRDQAFAVARYCLALAERAAREAQALADADRGDGVTAMSEDAIKTLAVRRAVEGGA